MNGWLVWSTAVAHSDCCYAHLSSYDKLLLTGCQYTPLKSISCCILILFMALFRQSLDIDFGRQTIKLIISNSVAKWPIPSVVQRRHGFFLFFLDTLLESNNHATSQRMTVRVYCSCGAEYWHYYTCSTLKKKKKNHALYIWKHHTAGR